MDLHAVEHEDSNLSRYVGLSLILGFTMMLLLDQGFLIYQEHQVNKQGKAKSPSTQSPEKVKEHKHNKEHKHKHDGHEHYKEGAEPLL